MKDFLSKLTAKGYKFECMEIRLYGGCTCYTLSKRTGPDRFDCSGGHIALLTDGTFAFDLFNGGDKYGQHITSYSDDAFSVATLPEEKIINFLA